MMEASETDHNVRTGEEGELQQERVITDRCRRSWRLLWNRKNLEKVSVAKPTLYRDVGEQHLSPDHHRFLWAEFPVYLFLDGGYVVRGKKRTGRNVSQQPMGVVDDLQGIARFIPTGIDHVAQRDVLG